MKELDSSGTSLREVARQATVIFSGCFAGKEYYFNTEVVNTLVGKYERNWVPGSIRVSAKKRTRSHRQMNALMVIHVYVHRWARWYRISSQLVDLRLCFMYAHGGTVLHRKSGSVACSALCILAPLHSTTKYGPCVCSFRTGGFVSSCRTTQDQGLLFYFTTGWFKHNPPPKKVLCAMSTSFLRVRPCKLDEDILNVQNFTVVTLKNSVDIWTFVRLSAKITAS